MGSWRAAGVALVGLLASCGSPALPAAGAVTPLQVEVLARYPHDTAAFTQGLEVHQGLLYESTGRYGQSEVRIVEPETGQVRAREALPDTAFGEGLTIVDDQIWQLTFQEEVAFLRDRATLAERDRVAYSGEGWGVCHDPGRDRLVMSDGTPELTFRDPETFDPIGSVTVTRDGEPLEEINELECVAGDVWANVWQTDEIVRIDPESGAVEAVVDASGLLTPEEQTGADVLNGIAVRPGLGGAGGGDLTFLITGKLWPWVFEVRFVPA